MNWTLCEGPESPYSGVDCKWASANPRGGTSVRSRPKSVRNRAVTRGNISCLIVRQALRRQRILRWVGGQKPRLTKDGKSIICKTDNFLPLVVPGSSTNPESGSSGASLSQDSLGKEAEEAPGELVQPAFQVHPETGAIPRKTQNQNKKRDDSRDSDDRLRDLSEWLAVCTENLENAEFACIGTQFSGLRFRTSCESGIKIKEAQCLLSLPKRRKLRSLFANQNDKGSLQKTHWRSSTSSRKVW